MKKRNRDGCPVCGRIHSNTVRCKQSILNAIDAANEAAWNRELDPIRLPQGANRRPFTTRLAEGFRMLRDDMED